MPDLPPVPTGEPEGPLEVAVEDRLRREIREELERRILRGYRWIALVIGFYQFLLLPVYFLNYPPGTPWVYSPLVSGSLLLSTWWVLKSPRLDVDLAGWIAVGGLTILLGQILMNLLAQHSLRFTSDLMLVVAGAPIVISRRARYFGFLAMILGGWLLLVGFAGLRDELLHWGVGLASASIVSLILFLHLRQVRRSQEDLRIQDRLREREKEHLIAWYSDALENIKTLRGLIPICAHCKKIRDDAGYWQQVEHFVKERSEAQFTHGICPDCAREMMAELKQSKG